MLALLALMGAALFAPASASAQSEEDLECVIDGIGLTDPEGDLGDILSGIPDLVADPSPEQIEERRRAIQDALEDALDDRVNDLEDCLEDLLGNGGEFCDDCDPTFDYQEILQALLRIDRGRALRQSLVACRDRTLNKTHSPDSRDRCVRLERVFELYVTDEGSVEARRKSGADPASVPSGGDEPAAAPAQVGLGVQLARTQRLRGGLSVGCRPPAGGLCRVEVLGRGTLIATGQRTIPAGSAATVTARPTRRGTALLRRARVVRARVLVRTPGAFTVRPITIKP